MDRGRTQKMHDCTHDATLYNLVTNLIYHNLLSLRQLLNFCRTKLVLRDTTIYFEKFGIEVTRHSPILGIIILTKLLGNFRELKFAIQHFLEHAVPITNLNEQYEHLVFFALRHIHKFSVFNESFHYKLPTDITLSIKLESKGETFSKIDIFDANGTGLFQPTVKDFYLLYLKTSTDLCNEKVIE